MYWTRNLPFRSVKVQVSSKICSIVCSFVFFCTGKHEPPLERESESFFIIWEIPVQFEDV